MKPHSILFNTILFLLFSLHTLYGADKEDSLQGPAFYDHSKQTQMPIEWIKKPIRYQKWVKDSDLAITLDQHIYEALLPYIQEFGKKHNLKLAVKEGTCGISAGMLSRKEVDIGGFCCPPAVGDRLPGLRFHTIGISALTILVNRSNPVEKLSAKQTRDIFQGKIDFWSNLNPPKSQLLPKRIIKPVARLHCKSRPGHWRLILDNEDLFGPNIHEVSSIPDMMIAIAAQKYAIGYETLWNITRFQVGKRVKFVKVDGYSPQKMENLIGNKYPYYRVYNVTTWEGDRSDSHAQQLVRYLINMVEKIDSKYGIIPAKELKKAGWRFNNDELIAEP